MMTGSPLLVSTNASIAHPIGVEVRQIEDRDCWKAWRKTDVTASAVGALLGVHDYLTPFGLYALKAGLVAEDPDETPAMRRGRLLEPVALKALAEDRPSWKVYPANDVYYRMPAARIGATPDAFAARPESEGMGIVQVKTASDMAFRKTWHDASGALQVPTWIACQAITEAQLTGSTWATICLLVVGNGLDIHVIDVPLHDGVWQRLQNEVAEFWMRVENERPYDLDYTRDAAHVHRIYAQDNSTSINLSTDNEIINLLIARDALKARERDGAEAEKARKVIDAQIIAKLGNAAGAILPGDGYLSAKTITVNQKPKPASSYSYRRISASYQASPSLASLPTSF